MQHFSDSEDEASQAPAGHLEQLVQLVQHEAGKGWMQLKSTSVLFAVFSDVFHGDRGFVRAFSFQTVLYNCENPQSECLSQNSPSRQMSHSKRMEGINTTKSYNHQNISYNRTFKTPGHPTPIIFFRVQKGMQKESKGSLLRPMPRTPAETRPGGPSWPGPPSRWGRDRAGGTGLGQVWDQMKQWNMEHRGT